MSNDSPRPRRTREDAYRLMTEWTESDSLRRHMLAVETAMRGAARRAGEDEELWGLAGLLHDFDYERHQTVPDHPVKGAEVLRAAGYPEEVVVAILGHATESGVPRESLMAKTLFAVDELTGLVQAAALVRPDRDVRGVELSSLKKRFKNRAFAAGVNRDEVVQGAEELGVDLDEHFQRVLTALQGAIA